MHGVFLDHKIKYKKSIPQYLKRRINRLSALFEIADEEFLNIYKEIVLEEKKIKDRLKRKATSDNAVPLDVFPVFIYCAKAFSPITNSLSIRLIILSRKSSISKKALPKKTWTEQLQSTLLLSIKLRLILIRS
jgi:hypothetical protein